jgi:hypothetical protein
MFPLTSSRETSRLSGKLFPSGADKVYNVFAGQQINAYYAGYKKGEIFTYNE